MSKRFIPLLLISPMLLGMARVNDTTDIFELTDLKIDAYNVNAVKMNKTDHGYLVSYADNYTQTDAFLRFKGVNDIKEVSVRDNRFLAIRYRANYDAKFAMRILSTTGSQTYNDFHFGNNVSETIESFSNWKTAVFELSYENARGVTENIYNAWTEGDYTCVSFNITNQALFEQDSYLLLSSFAFFPTNEEAKAFLGASYSQVEDEEGPNIDIPYGDGETYHTTCGRKMDFVASYYDEYDGFGGETTGVLSSGALDENGLLTKGNHIVTFTASDLSGNISTKELQLVVGDRDNDAPIINFNADTLYVLANSYNKLVFSVYDEVDGEVGYELSYSPDAINDKGQFNVGTHTLTIAASDFTGNVATKIITIISGYDINPDGLQIIDEGEI